MRLTIALVGVFFIFGANAMAAGNSSRYSNQIMIQKEEGGGLERPTDPITYLMKYGRMWGIKDRNEFAALLGQSAHESGGFKELSESGNYSVAGLRKTFKYARGKSDAHLADLLKDEKKLFNAVYGNLSALGNRGGDDGFNFRGSGFGQVTGRDNIKKALATVKKMRAEAGLPPLDSKYDAEDGGLEAFAEDVRNNEDLGAQATVAWWLNNVHGKVEDWTNDAQVSAMVNRGPNSDLGKEAAEVSQSYKPYRDALDAAQKEADTQFRATGFAMNDEEFVKNLSQNVLLQQENKKKKAEYEKKKAVVDKKFQQDINAKGESVKGYEDRRKRTEAFRKDPRILSIPDEELVEPSDEPSMTDPEVGPATPEKLTQDKMFIENFVKDQNLKKLNRFYRRHRGR